MATNNSTLPSFIVIGAAKSGTTSLYHYLRAHPEVFMPELKELNYFVAEVDRGPAANGDRRKQAGRWALGLDWYTRQFAGAGNGFKAVGEASPRYAMHPFVPGVPERMAALLPDAKLIYLVRDPVVRMVSHAMHRMHATKETLPLERAVLESPVYVNASRYAQQIEGFLQFYPRSQLKVVISEQLRSDRDRTLASIFEFIGVDPTWRDTSVSDEHNVSAPRRAGPRPLTRAVMASRAWNPVAHRVPDRPKRLGRRLTHRAVQTEIPPELERTLTDLVRDDVARLREYVDDPGFDGWGRL